MPLVIVLYGYFLLAFVYGLVLSKGQWKGWIRIMRHPGRAVADFVYMDGVGATFLNMGLVGILATSFILLIGGDLSGPVVGAILTVFGFGAFGVHLRNYAPVLLGVLLATLITVFEITAPAIQLAAVFSMGVAPIAGQFGPVAGLLAGFLHLAIVSCTNDMYGGLNLYNNGFSCGWVAIIMVPFVESFIKRFDTRKKNKGGLKR